MAKEVKNKRKRKREHTSAGRQRFRTIQTLREANHSETKQTRGSNELGSHGINWKGAH